MGKKNKKVPPIIDREVIPLAVAGKPVAGSIGAIVDRKKVPPIVIEQPIIDRKPGIAAAAALADAEQNPILIKAVSDSLIAGEQPGIDLKNLGIGTLAGAVKPVVEPKPKPESTGGNSAGSDSQP